MSNYENKDCQLCPDFFYCLYQIRKKYLFTPSSEMVFQLVIVELLQSSRNFYIQTSNRRRCSLAMVYLLFICSIMQQKQYHVFLQFLFPGSQSSD